MATVKTAINKLVLFITNTGVDHAAQLVNTAPPVVKRSNQCLCVTQTLKGEE